MQNQPRDILAIAEEAKRRTNVMHSITIDWQCAQTLLPTVIKRQDEQPEGFWEQCETLTRLLCSLEENIKSLKEMVPVPEAVINQ